MNAATKEIHKPLIEGSKRGDRRAQFELYKLYSDAMFNICYRMMNRREEAEDMLQEGFSLAFKRLKTFRYESTFGAWLKRIIVNHCINELKRRKAELVLDDEISNKMEENETVDMGNDNYANLSVDKIKKAMNMLPDGYRVVFSLYLLEGYDHQEIGEIMGISASTSKSQFSRAKKKVKELMN